MLTRMATHNSTTSSSNELAISPAERMNVLAITPIGEEMTMKTLRFGIEIETVGLSRAQLARTIAEVTGGPVSGSDRYAISDGAGREWRVVPDGSLSGRE